MVHSFDSHISHTFDSFCKAIVRNEARNIKKQYARLRERQISLTELPRELESTFQVVDTSVENSEIFIALGMELLVSILTLAEAIHQLNEIKRKIVLLYYFGGFNDREIGRLVSTKKSSIRIKRYLGGEILCVSLTILMLYYHLK